MNSVIDKKLKFTFMSGHFFQMIFMTITPANRPMTPTSRPMTPMNRLMTPMNHPKIEILNRK